MLYIRSFPVTIKAMRFFLLILCSLHLAGIAYAASFTAIVTRIIDGDSLILDNTETVRLLDINTPELAYKNRPAEPLANEAKQILETLALNKKVVVYPGNTARDRHNRLLAHVYAGDTWLNGLLVEKGLAYIYTFPDNRETFKRLEPLEQQARATQQGLWALPRWQIRNAQGRFPHEDYGNFYLTTGKVREAVQIRDKIYLNFGPDWRTDFTVEIPEDYWPLFITDGINPQQHYTGKPVLVRGKYKPVNGTLVTVTHPEQIQITE